MEGPYHPPQHAAINLSVASLKPLFSDVSFYSLLRWFLSSELSMVCIKQSSPNLPYGFGFFFPQRLAPALTTVAILFYFCFFSPNPPSTWLYILLVGHSSCGTWDAASPWPNEQCHVCGQDPNQRNPGLAKRNART